MDLAFFGNGALWGDQLPGRRGLGVVEHVRYRALLHNVAVGDNGDPVADLLHDLHLMVRAPSFRLPVSCFADGVFNHRLSVGRAEDF